MTNAFWRRLSAWFLSARFDTRGRRTPVARRFQQLRLEPLEDRRMLAVNISDTFNRVDPTHTAAANNALGGTGSHFYINIFPTGGGATITSNQLRNAGVDFGGVQFAASTSSSGENIGQDLHMQADLTAPKDASGNASWSALYFRSRAAAPNDGINGGSSSGYWVKLHSTGEVSVRPLNTVAGGFSAWTARPAAFDSSIAHTMQVAFTGTTLQVAVDGQLQTFLSGHQGNIQTTSLSIPAVSGSNNGTGGVAFGAEANRGAGLGGQTADNLIVSSYASLTGLPVANYFTSTLDYGDAPDTGDGRSAGNYNTTGVDNGPSHVITPGLRIGATVDGENDATPNAAANGDDLTGSDDEDGISGAISLAKSTNPSIDVNVTNTTGTAATLAGWIDFDGNGLFHSTEGATVTVPSGTSGAVTLVFPTVPTSAVSSTYARFRLSTDSAGLNPVGAASDGEVEDYPVTITSSLAVTTTNDVVNAGDGLLSLREAIIQANASPGADTIALPNGVYTLTLAGRGENAAATGDLDITGALTIIGASQNGTIIQAGASAATGIDRVFEVLPGGSASFQSLTIQHGNAWTVGDDGGGIQAVGDNFSGQNAVVALSRVTVRDNIAGRGAGINNNLATSTTTLTIVDSTITGNEGHNRGGGLGVGGFGTLYLTRSTVSDNSTTENAGGIALHTSTSGVITSSTISGNTSENTGGGILTFGGTNPLTIINSTISGNQAKNSSGGIHADADLTIINSTITGNNGDIDNNGSGIGGGIIIGNRSQTIYNSIIAGNFKGTTPSDIENVGDTINTAANNIIGNASTSSGINHGVSGNIVGNGGSGTINIASVLNTTLANNGGTTLTHALAGGSPALNAGNNAWLPADARDLDGDANTSEALPVDQRGVGFVRVFGAAVDIGAYEENTASNAPPTIVTSGSATTAEDVATTISGISVSDADSATLSVTITAAQGSVTIGTAGLSITGNGTANVVASGTIANLNSALSSLQFAPNTHYNGMASVTITADDGSVGSDTETISINVTEVNDPPTAINDTLANSPEDGGVRVISFASLTVNDSRGPGNESGQTLTITSLSNIVGGSAIINGTNIEFTPTTNYNGSASFNYTVRDNGTTNGVNDFQTSSASVNFAITAVNDPPVISLAVANATVNEDTLLAITGISVSDVDAGSGSVSVRLHAGHGVITAATNVAGGVTSGQIAGNGAATVTITASLAAINATLGDPNGLRYLSATNFNGGDALTITVNDLGQTGSGGAQTDTDTIAITVNAVNDAPSITAVSLTPANPLTTDNLTATPQGYFDVENSPAQYSYQWFVNGATVAATTSTLTADHFNKGDTVVVRVTPSDGSASGGAVDSNSVLVKIVPTISVARASGYFTGSPFVASATVRDPDDQSIVASSPHPSLTFDFYVGANTAGQHLPGAPTAVGTYTVVASYAGAGFYTSVQSTPLTFAIAGSIVVTTSSDLPMHVGTSLRDAVEIANFAATQGLSDTITFDTDAMGATHVLLSQGALEFTGSTGVTTINGAGVVTIHGDAQIHSAAAVTLTGIGIPGTWTNGGSLTLSSGSGQPFTINGTIINTGHALTLSGTSGFTLASGTIQGGTVAATLGATLSSSGYGVGGGTLSGVTFNGNLSVPDFTGLVVTNGLTLNGTLAIGNTSVVYAVGTQTFGGNGDVLFTGIRSALQVSATNSTLTIGAGITIHGGSFLSNGTFAGAVIGYSDFWSGSPNANIVNEGTIIADAASSFLTINPTGTFSNAGTISAANGGTLNVQGNWTSTTSVSVVDASAVNLGGTWPGVNLTASGGGTINAGGTLSNGADVTLHSGPAAISISLAASTTPVTR